MDTFIFNELTEEELTDYIDNAYVFNMKRDNILKEKIELLSFEDDSIGSSQEKLDVAVLIKNEWKLLKIDDKIKEYNEIPLGYVLDGYDFDRVLVIIRRMSTVVFDKLKESSSSVIYSKLGSDFTGIEDFPSLMGKFAKNHIYLDGTYNEVKKSIVDSFSGSLCEELLSDLERLVR